MVFILSLSWEEVRRKRGGKEEERRREGWKIGGLEDWREGRWESEMNKRQRRVCNFVTFLHTTHCLLSTCGICNWVWMVTRFALKNITCSDWCNVKQFLSDLLSRYHRTSSSSAVRWLHSSVLWEYSYHLEREDGGMCVGEGGRKELTEEAIHDTRFLLNNH